MTEKEIKEYVTEIRHKADIFRKSGFATAGITNVFDKSADIIEELLPYMAIGTIEEIKALKEKNKPKKPLHQGYVYACPCCNDKVTIGSTHLRLNQKYCADCGTELDWQ